MPFQVSSPTDDDFLIFFYRRKISKLRQQVNNLQKPKVVAIESRLFNDLLGLKGTSLARQMNQQLVFGLETYRSKLASPKDWNSRLRMSPPSSLFSYFHFPSLSVVFLFSRKEFQKSKNKKSRTTTTRGRRNPSHGRWQCQGFATTTRFDNHLDSFFGIQFPLVLKAK